MVRCNESIRTRNISEIWRDVVAWCVRKGIQNWLSGFAFFIMIILGVITIVVSCKGGNQLDAILKSWEYLTGAILAPISEFVAFLLGCASKTQCDRAMNENRDLKSRLSKVELIEQNMESIFGVWLNLILVEVKFEGDCRASFYVWDDKGSVGSEFVYLARESNDPKLRRKGRERFPGNQGVISEAWHNKEGAASYFASKNVKTEEDVVNDMVDKYRFDMAAANSLTMKSKVILGHVIVGRYGKVGVVIVESLHGVKQKEKRDLYKRRCADVVKKVTPHITRLFEIYSNSMFKQEDPIEELQCEK